MGTPHDFQYGDKVVNQRRRTYRFEADTAWPHDAISREPVIHVLREEILDDKDTGKQIVQQGAWDYWKTLGEVATQVVTVRDPVTGQDTTISAAGIFVALEAMCDANDPGP